MKKLKDYVDTWFQLIPIACRSLSFVHNQREAKVFAVMTMINIAYLSMEIL